jgi:hypothetical protein
VTASPGGPEGEPPRKRSKRPWTGWLHSPPGERMFLTRVITAIGFASAVTAYIQPGHGLLFDLALGTGISIAVVVAAIAIYRSVIHRVQMPIALGLVGAIAAALLGAWAGAKIRSFTDRSPTAPILATGTIAAPRNGALIIGGAPLSASGTVRDLPPGYRLDLFLKIPSVPTYYAAGDPRNVLTIRGDDWSGSIYIGAQGPCTVYLVELSPASVVLMNSEILYQSDGYPSITALGTILASVTLSAN